MSVRILFERELQNRGLRYTIDIESGRHAIEVGARQLLVSLDNLQRDVERDGDTERVSRFVDSIVGATSVSAGLCSADRLYWCVEPNDYEDMASFRVPLSDRVDRALVHLSADGQLITWATPDMLEALGLSESDASSRGFTNLARRLTESTIEYEEVDGVQLGFIDTPLPFKASFILAPNLREVVASALGWPLMAVVPDRDFLYIWAARHSDFIERVGDVVVREFSQASYPISTEVYEITDTGVRAIGEFPTGA